MLLAGDIGGTKTNLAVFSNDEQDGWRKPLAEATFPSGRYPSLEALAEEFQGQHHFQIDRASFGVAGPVVNGRATITNLPWVLEENHLKKALDIPSVSLLNDLTAIAHGVPYLGPDDLHTLNAGHSVNEGSIAVVAPGTGLGEAFLTWHDDHYYPHTSEGGHADFAPADELQLELLRYLQLRYTHVSFERVCSGKGLPNIYVFLKESGHAAEPDWLAEALAKTKDPTPVIVDNALDTEHACEICTTTMELFVSILGAEVGNMALKVLATGGVFIGGGIPPRILPFLSEGRFMQSFLRKGRLSNVLIPVPVYVILNPNIALLGAARHGFEKAHEDD
ncbi:MAG TPA: glucokinase [Ktedonobacteraceae bacterium]|nr:glucokinase [Ktedonobacteraceae bacterium]